MKRKFIAVDEAIEINGEREKEDIKNKAKIIYLYEAHECRLHSKPTIEWTGDCKRFMNSGTPNATTKFYWKGNKIFPFAG